MLNIKFLHEVASIKYKLRNQIKIDSTLRLYYTHKISVTILLSLWNTKNIKQFQIGLYFTKLTERFDRTQSIDLFILRVKSDPSAMLVDHISY